MTMQNTSHAVMNQRAPAPDDRDDFPTPPWATRALLQYVIADKIDSQQTVLEPAAGRGFMVRPLKEYFEFVWFADKYEYETLFEYYTEDFLERGGYFLPDNPKPVDWVITNPPFIQAEMFALRAIEQARVGVALLVRSNFAEGRGRYERLFRERPPARVAQFVERVPMVRGRCDPAASTATSYIWMVWLAGVEKTEFRWIPPCRKDLERAGDYEISAI